MSEKEDFTEKVTVLVEVLTSLIQMLTVTYSKPTPEKPDPEIFEKVGVR